jgi:hypothetical protein
MSVVRVEVCHAMSLTACDSYLCHQAQSPAETDVLTLDASHACLLNPYQDS